MKKKYTKKQENILNFVLNKKNNLPLFGNKKSHALNTTPKKWSINYKTIVINNKKFKISLKNFKTLKKYNIVL